MIQRRTLMAALGGLSLIAAAPWAQADSGYPNRPIRILVGYQPGGPTDVVARLIAKGLQDELGQPAVVDNKPGAGGNLAAETVATAAPDGYTLLVTAATFTMNPNIYKGQKYDPEASFQPISKLTAAPSVLAVSPKLPARTWQELLTTAQREPGKLSYGTPGVGGTQHMATERLLRVTGIQATHVPYKGGAAVTADLIAGHIDMALTTTTGAMAHMRSGAIRPLAVTGNKRLSELPDVPTFAELGVKDMPSDAWNGLLAPKGTPKAVVDRIYAAVKKTLTSRAAIEQLQPLGAEIVGNTPAEFAEEIPEEVKRWKNEFKLIDPAKLR